MRLSISEILENASRLGSDSDKILYLRQNYNGALTTVLKYAYDPSLKFLLPETSPPYTRLATGEGHGMLYHEARKLYLFVEGGNSNLTQNKREILFVQLLESVDPKDAELLICVKNKSLPYGITYDIVEQAFPGLIPPKATFQENTTVVEQPKKKSTRERKKKVANNG